MAAYFKRLCFFFIMLYMGKNISIYLTFFFYVSVNCALISKAEKLNNLLYKSQILTEIFYKQGDWI